MPPIKPMSAIVKKWQDRARTSADNFRDGVQNTTKDWASNTAAATENYNAGVQEAIAAGRFSAGVARAGNSTWKTNTLAKGVTRWPQGIQASGDKYTRNFSPYREVIANTQLSPRGPKGSAQNYNRVREVGEALHNAKLAGA